MNRKLAAAGLLALATLVPAGLSAQLPVWDAPSFMSPGRHDDLGFYFIKPEDTDWGIAGTWRTGDGLNLGVRGQYVQITEGLDQWGIGAEIKGGIGDVAPPLAIAWTAGLGATSGADVTILRIPVGLSLGLHLRSGGLTFTPYVHPRVSFAYFSFDKDVGLPEGDDSDTDFLFDTDVGVDLDLGTSPLIVRFGATFGDQPALGAGLAFKLGRR